MELTGSVNENTLLQWDLYKSYGEFNFLFEDTIQKFRDILINLIRLSYNYFEEEDEHGNELPDEEENRLLKILLNNVGAMDIVKNCKICFVDFFNQQKKKYGKYCYQYYEYTETLNDNEYKLALEVFKKAIELVELRNVLIHSHYLEIYASPENHSGKLKGRIERGTSKGYEHRKYNFDLKFLERINNDIKLLHIYAFQVNLNISPPRSELYDFHGELESIESMKRMNFSVDQLMKDGEV